MSALSLYSMIVNVSNVINELKAAGMRIEVGDDFVAYRRLRNAQTERSGLYPMFDVSCSYVDQTNAFWVCGFDENDQLVHTQAIRLLDLSGVTLAQHMNMHRHKYITPNSTPDPDMTFYTRARALEKISGKVCYHGEFWVKGIQRGLRKQSFTPLLSRLAFELARKTWNPDYVFGFVPTALAMKGIQMHYGYTHCEPGVWHGPDQQVTDEDSLVWMDREDIAHFLHLPPQGVSRDRDVPVQRPLVTKPTDVIA